MWKKPASHRQEGGIISRRKSKSVIKQFGISSAVAELIRPMLASNTDSLYGMIASISLPSFLPFRMARSNDAQIHSLIHESTPTPFLL